MKEKDDKAVIADLQAKLQAQKKTVEVLMDVAEKRASSGESSLKLLSQNLDLERIVQQKTETLRLQGEELKKALQDLQMTQARLLHSQKMEAVGQLAAGIAHEINTPAQFIASNVEFIEESFPHVVLLVDALRKAVDQAVQGMPPEVVYAGIEQAYEDLDWDYLAKEIPAAIRQSKEGVRRVSTIVQAMKEFSHPGKKEKAYHDLNRIIETTVTVARNEWKYHARVECRLDPQLPLVFCLADEMGQVILNLLINASHAIAAKNSGRPEDEAIVISTTSSREYAEIHIKDTGVGIPQAIQQRIFDPFFTTKGVGKGTGQGLAIVHDVIEKKHGGTIWVCSEVGEGSLFIIKLPISAE